MGADSSEQSLVQQAIAGERLALERLLLMHARRLSQHLAPKIPESLQGVVDADDILQQTFLQVFRDIRDFEPTGQGSFYAWLRGIAENRLFDCIRQQKRKKRGGDFKRQVAVGGAESSAAADILDMLSGKKGTPSVSVARRELIDAVHVGLACLPEDQRKAIQLHCLEGRSLEETAELMEKTPGAIRALVHRGKGKLQEQLDRSAIWLSQGG
jgi:RNA polymerase sigma-70 factor (ECF subfamily)